MGEHRHRHTVWMDDTVWDQVESHYQKDNCSTKNEYIEKAIQFYSGYRVVTTAYIRSILSECALDQECFPIQHIELILVA